MNWKNEAMEKLRRYEAMKKAVVNIPVELHRLQVEACATRGMSTDQVCLKGGVSRREERLMNNLVCQQELKWNLDQSRSWIKATEQALKSLTTEERLILQRLYIYPEKGAVERLCRELGVEQSTVYRHRDQALYKFTTALYGYPES